MISFNINRKNNNLRFFEFGKTYSTSGVGRYDETNHLCIYLTGDVRSNHWKEKSVHSDIYYIKGVAEAVLKNIGIEADSFHAGSNQELSSGMHAEINGEKLIEFGKLNTALAGKFDIKQAVYFADLNWDTILKHIGKRVQFKEIPRYPAVERDLALVVDRSMQYQEIQEKLKNLGINKLQEVKLFDVFESEKLGAGKKSMAINFTFLDLEKTLTDKEIDTWMNKIMITLEKELNAEIRK